MLRKKYRIPVLIELVMIGIMVFFGKLVFQMEDSRISREENEAVMYVGNWPEDYHLPGEKVTVDGFIHYVMEHLFKVVPMRIFSSSKEQNLTNCYGMYLEVYDSEGNILKKTTPHLLTVGWLSQDFIQDTGEININEDGREVLFLEEYFPKEEIQAYLSWAEDNGFLSGTAHSEEVRYINGYYDAEDHFIPVEVFFEKRVDETKTFLMKNNAVKNIISQEKLVQRTEPGDSASEADWKGKTEYGMLTSYHFTTDTKINKRAEDVVREKEIDRKKIVSGEEAGAQLLYKVKGLYNEACFYGPLKGEEAAGYMYVICVDTDYLIWHNSYFVGTVKSIVLFCQFMAAVLIGVSLYTQRKEQNIKKMRDTFLNAIAHEMKTPAAVIQNGVECIQAGIHPEKQERYQEMINQEAVHMNQLVNSMLTYTRVHDSVYELNVEPYPLDRLTERVCSHYSTLMEQKGITLQWEKHDFHVAFYDVRLIEMVLDNFVSNAVKFCNQGGNICIHLEKQGVRIFNEGDEISEECRAHMWEPFYKGDKARTATDGSSGMGLAVSAAILELHKAEYGMNNVPGGVEFYFYLH